MTDRTDSSAVWRQKAREHEAAFDEAHEKGEVGASWEAMDSLAAETKADDLYRLEHPELERLEGIQTAIGQIASVLNLTLWCLGAIVVLLIVIAYRLW